MGGQGPGTPSGDDGARGRRRAAPGARARTLPARGQLLVAVFMRARMAPRRLSARTGVQSVAQATFLQSQGIFCTSIRRSLPRDGRRLRLVLSGANDTALAPRVVQRVVSPCVFVN